MKLFKLKLSSIQKVGEKSISMNYFIELLRILSINSFFCFFEYFLQILELSVNKNTLSKKY